MANFHTHIAVAAAGSGILASTVLAADAVTPGQATVLWAVGAGAGLLPDIDSDSSRSIRWIFNGLAVISALITLMVLHNQLSLYALWAAMGFTYMAIRYGAMPLFAEWTVHRGIFHSVLVLPFFTLATVLLSDQVFQLPVYLSWLAGLFVLFGAFIHLLLDEIYAVDLEGARLKASFGTALKLFSFNNLLGSAGMAAAVAVLFIAVPPIEPFVQFVAAVDWLEVLNLPV